ncbi:MAG TPA: dihydrofolate reductase family protein [Acidimicrobiia bacterium]
MALRQLASDPRGNLDPTELAEAGERRADGRPWVMLNFVASIDGAATIDGGSTDLGDEEDMAMFKALRGVADVVLVGARTVIVEDYRPLSLDETRRARRVERGQDPAPTLAIVSGTVSLDVEQRVFSDSSYKPLVITGPYANPGRLANLGDAADVAILPDIDPQSIVDSLSGAGIILLEGGPSLAGQFARAGLIDEFNLTVAPKLAGGESKRITGSDEIDPPYEMRLDRVVEGENMLFLRYVARA